ncbi:DUF2190 family protein [Lentisphaerota bacterium WC36G]|nr:DUF2190 family protein [Lentisphaerae bacterium WC36]
MSNIIATFVHEDGKIDYLNSTNEDVICGSIVVVGSMLGVSDGTIKVNHFGALATNRVWDVTKDTAIAVTTGDKLYYDATANQLTTDASENIFFGFAIADSDVGEEVVRAWLKQ